MIWKGSKYIVNILFDPAYFKLKLHLRTFQSSFLKVRRGKNKIKKFKVYYNNIRGIKSKIKSIKEIIENDQPTLIGIVETHLNREDEIEIKEYEVVRNDRNENGGGILIAYRKELKNIIMEVGREAKNGESLWVL